MSAQPHKRALTPLIHAHINPYGLFPLDLDQRLIIEVVKMRSDLNMPARAADFDEAV